MRLLRLIIDDAFGYAHQELDFGPMTAAVIVGKNGSGKSSLIDCITWALFGRYRGKGDRIIRRHTPMARVRVEFASRGERWVVIREKPRDKTGTLYFGAIEGEVTDRAHTIAETEARIRHVIGLDYDALRSTTLMVQDDAERRDLMKLDPRLRKDLVIELFDIAGYPVLHEEAKTRRDAAKVTAAAAERRMGDMRGLLAGEGVARATLAEAERAHAKARALIETTGSRMNEAKVAYAAAAERASRSAVLEARLVAINRAASGVQDTLARNNAASDRALAALGADPPIFPIVAAASAQGPLSEGKRRLAEAQTAKERRAVLNGEELHLQAELSRASRALDVKVPCNREGIYAACPLLVGLPSAEAVEALKHKLAGVVHERAATVLVADQYPSLKAEVDQLQEMVTEAATEQAHYEASKRAHEQAQVTARSTLADVERNLVQARDELSRLMADRDQVQAEQAEVTEAVAAAARAQAARTEAEHEWVIATENLSLVHEPALRRAQGAVAVIDQAKAQLPAIEAELGAAQAEQRKWDVVAGLFHRDGIPTMVLADGLPAIETRANEVLERMPEEMKLRLLTESITKKGTLSDTLDIEVIHEGEATDYAMLSGAQRFRVDLALRLGQGRILSHRSGAAIETLLLDEADRDLDDEGTEALVESLNAVADEFGLILVVSHHGRLTERIPFRIEVSRSHGISRAEVF